MSATRLGVLPPWLSPPWLSCGSVLHKKKKKKHFINPLQGHFFPHSVVLTHITHTGEDIHEHTHNHMQIGEVAEQRGCQGSSFEVRCLALGHLGSGVGGELAPLQLPAHSHIFLVQSGREPATLRFQDQVPTDLATAASD